MKTTTKAKAPKTTKAKGEYILEVVMNGETVTIETADINKALVDMNPELLHTEVYVKVTKGENVCERRLSRTEALRVFRVEENREVLVNNLLIVNG